MIYYCCAVEDGRAGLRIASVFGTAQHFCCASSVAHRPTHRTYPSCPKHPTGRRRMLVVVYTSSPPNALITCRIPARRKPQHPAPSETRATRCGCVKLWTACATPILRLLRVSSGHRQALALLALPPPSPLPVKPAPLPSPISATPRRQQWPPPPGNGLNHCDRRRGGSYCDAVDR